MNYKNIKYAVFDHLDTIGDELVKSLLHSYNTVFSKLILFRILSSVFNKLDFNNLTKFELHSIFNDIMCQYHIGEQWYKYKLFHRDILGNSVSAYELRVNKSRLDYISINGHTLSYEIKSSIDTLQKLSKQVTDYEKLFEYNCVVIDSKHFDKCFESLPQNYGLITLKNGELVVKREPIKNILINPESQLNILTKKELLLNFKEFDGNKKRILDHLKDENEINEIFKRVLKARYDKRFNFIRQNYNRILPIDYQFFFNKNVAPSILYNINYL